MRMIVLAVTVSVAATVGRCSNRSAPHHRPLTPAAQLVLTMADNRAIRSVRIGDVIEISLGSAHEGASIASNAKAGTPAGDEALIRIGDRRYKAVMAGEVSFTAFGPCKAPGCSAASFWRATVIAEP